MAPPPWILRSAALLARRRAALAAGAVLVSAVLIVVVLVGRPTPLPPGTARRPPDPSALRSPAPTGSVAAPSATVTAPSGAAPQTGPPHSPAPTSPTGVALQPGPYGFSYPPGWVLSPLVARSAQVQAARVTDPAGPGRIDYVVDSSPAIYNPDRTINLAIVGLAIPAAAGCPAITARQYLPNRGLSYRCAGPGGLDISGLVLILAYPQGFRLLQVQVPAAGLALSQAILGGYR